MSALFKKFVSIAFVMIILLLSLPIITYADELETPEQEPVVEEFVTISTCDATITKSGIKVTCSANLDSRYSTNLSITMVLQKYSSGSYTDVKTWTKTGSGVTLDISETRTINILYTYRLKVIFTAGNESYTTYAYY